ncbi:MAG: hypothetical protein H8E57_04950, partial [Candidatus Cloacimonetes bacterium]|nr:hypothetical protein [Candidatus Cloacimonadota bacterium]
MNKKLSILFLLLFITGSLTSNNIFHDLNNFIKYRILGNEKVRVDTFYFEKGIKWISFPAIDDVTADNNT